MKPTAHLVATDIVLFSKLNNQNVVLLIMRKNPPFKNAWALPGGFLDVDEDLENCALRELEEETSVKLSQLNFVGVYGNPNRDPRGRVISVAYAALVNINQHEPKAADDAKNVGWKNLEDLPTLAFDHQQIIADAARIVEF